MSYEIHASLAAGFVESWSMNPEIIAYLTKNDPTSDWASDLRKISDYMYKKIGWYGDYIISSNSVGFEKIIAQKVDEYLTKLGEKYITRCNIDLTIE